MSRVRTFGETKEPERRMIIAVNTRFLQKGKLEGIGWFTRETLSRITKDHPVHRFIFIFDRPYDDAFIFSENVIPVVLPPVTETPLCWFIWFEIQIPRILKKYKADLFLSPDGFLSLRTRIRQLPVIHDINFAHRPKDFPWLTSIYYRLLFPHFAKRAKRIVTVSLFSKEDISRLYKIAPENIDVVYNGVNMLYSAILPEEKIKAKEKYSEGKDYFLYVGSLHPRKNIPGLLRAYDAFRMATGKDINLIIAGCKITESQDVNLDKTFKGMRFGKNVIFTGRLNSEDLHEVLGAATALIFVPFIEGFGIPVIEGMRAGIPVICSNTTSLPEVGGDAVLYADPFSVDQIRDAMIRIIENEVLKNSLIKKGLKQQQKFSWDRTADSLWGSIQICMNS